MYTTLGGARETIKEQIILACSIIMVTVLVEILGEWIANESIIKELFSPFQEQESIPVFNENITPKQEISTVDGNQLRLAEKKPKIILHLEDAVSQRVLEENQKRANKIRDNVTRETKKTYLELLQQKTLEENLRVNNNKNNIVCDANDITRISNMTKEEIDTMVEGTWLEGRGGVLYQTEQAYGINAFFIYAVGTLESDHGRSVRAINRSNYYGIELTVDYVSYENCTRFFADMINRLYVSDKDIGVDIDAIGPVYCPPNPKWASIVNEIMQSMYKKMVPETLV